MDPACFNFAEVTFIQGALKCGEIIHALVRRLIWKPGTKGFEIQIRELVVMLMDILVFMF